MVAVSGFQTIGVDNLTPHIGAEIDGVDLSKDLSNEQFSEIYQAWLDWKVIVFRDCLLYTSPSPRDLSTSRMPSSA